MRVRTIRVTHDDTLPLIREIGVIRGPFTPANSPEDGGASNMNTERLSNPSRLNTEMRLLARDALFPHDCSAAFTCSQIGLYPS
jgi:hypothetical protein